MPFYEYECTSCKHHVEVLQKISAAPLLKCPDCGKKQLKRLISAPVFRLKGGGWYETDFKTDQDKKRNLAGADEAPPSKDESKSETQASTKADAASDAKPAQIKAEAKPADKKPETASKSASKNRTNLAKPKPARSRPVAKKKAARR